MNILFLILTALSVSADSFFCGLALLMKSKGGVKCVLSVATAVFILCLTGSSLGKILGNFLKNYAEILGGIILFLVGLTGIFKNKKNEIKRLEKFSLKQSLLVGFSIGLDGAVGSFSLTASGFNYIFVALFITFFHVILLILALFLAEKLSKRIKKESKTPSIILMCLGLYKLLF